MMLRYVLIMLTALLVSCTPSHDAPVDTFSQRYLKLDAQGKALPATAMAWRCVKDKTTNLIWENKTRDEGPFHTSWTYAWHDQSLSQPIRATSGACNQRYLSSCTTEQQVQFAQAKQLCGLTNWRLPTTSELQSLLQPSPEAGMPKFCDCHIANTQQSGYWTADRRQNKGRTEISVVNFRTGEQQWHTPGNFFYVRLVSSD